MFNHILKFFYIFFIKKSKHVTIFKSKYSDKLQQLRDKLQYLHYWNDQEKKREKKKGKKGRNTCKYMYNIYIVMIYMSKNP